MNILRFALLWAFCPGSLFAQSDFLKDPDIVWAIEMEQDWVVDGSAAADELQNGVSTLKLLCENPDNVFSSAPSLSFLVSTAIASGEIPIFTDPSCSKPTDWKTVLGSSDVVVFDPGFFEESVQEIWNVFAPELFKMWRLRQVLAFHQKCNCWTTTVQSIAPLARIVNAEGDSIDTKPIFWFKAFNERQNLDSKQVVWAKRILNKSAKTQLAIEHFRPIKQHKDFPGLLSVFESIVLRHPEIPLHHGTENQLLTISDRSRLIADKDTVTDYLGPGEPDAEAVQVVSINRLAQVKSLRLVQTWYWDNERHQLSICLDAMAPMRHVLNEDGTLRFTTPLYYQKVGH